MLCASERRGFCERDEDGEANCGVAAGVCADSGGAVGLRAGIGLAGLRAGDVAVLSAFGHAVPAGRERGGLSSPEGWKFRGSPAGGVDDCGPGYGPPG